MKCQKCGYLRKPQDHNFVPENECPACGVIYGKLTETEQAPPKQRLHAPSPLGNPSPVSASSLKKARERVERRLRQQELSQHRDSRHIQTLKLARELTAEGVRRRQAEWNKQKAHKAEASQPDKACETPEPLPKQMGSGSKARQAACTIAQALKKKEKEPLTASDTERIVPNDKATAITVNTLPDDTETHKDQEPMPIKNEKSQAIDKGLDIQPPPEPKAPIPLFQNTPKTIKKNKTATPSLKEMLEDYDAVDCKQTPSLGAHLKSGKGPHNRLMRLLPLVAWMILGAGIIGALLSWTTLANAQTSMTSTDLPGLGTMPLGLLLGFAYLATGVLGFAFFWVSSLISRQLKDIQLLLRIQSPSHVEPEKAADA